MEQPVPLKILYAEDEDTLRQIITSILNSQPGYQVDSCCDGDEAIALLKQKPYDIVLLDYKMPNVSGLNVLQWMHEQKMETPAIMMTGAGSEVVAVEAMKFGAYDYVRKELTDIDHLFILINGVYERYLFKKEKNLRLESARDNLEAIMSFNETVTPIASILTQALTKMSADIESYERELKPSMDADGELRLREAFTTIKQGHSIIAFAVSSILNLTKSMCESIAEEKQKHIATNQETLFFIPADKEPHA